MGDKRHSKVRLLSGDYIDGWYRTYIGYPDMNDMVTNMLKEFASKGDTTKIFLFFNETCNFGDGYSSFLMREVMSGEIWIG